MMDQDFLNNVMTDSDVTTKSRRSRMSETKKHRFIFLLVRHCSTFVNRKTQLFSWITYRSSWRCLWVLTRLWSRLSEHNVLVFGRNSLLDEVSTLWCWRVINRVGCPCRLTQITVEALHQSDLCFYHPCFEVCLKGIKLLLVALTCHHHQHRTS